MLIGWCGRLEQAEIMARAGCDYIELALAEQSLEADAAVRSARIDAIKRAALPALAFNVFLPRELRIVGEAIDDARIDRYLGGAAEVLASVGARIAVMGSGWSRNIPAGFDRYKAKEQIASFLGRVADRLKGSGATLAIEPLNRGESNVINSVSEGVEFAERVNRREIRVLADFYHMDEEREPLEEIEAHAAWLAHIHLADTGRRNPGAGSYDFDRFFAALRRSGYEGMMSAECRIDNPEADMRHSMNFLRRHWPVNAGVRV